MKIVATSALLAVLALRAGGCEPSPTDPPDTGTPAPTPEASHPPTDAPTPEASHPPTDAPTAAPTLPMATDAPTAEPTPSMAADTPTPMGPTPNPEPTHPPTPGPACAYAPGEAGVLRVPESCPSLQAALHTAADGDTVSLAPGLRTGTFDIPPRALTLAGRGEPDLTILDGGGLGTTLTAAGDGHTPLTLRDLTVTGGLAEAGGGLKLTGRDATLTRVVVAGNRAATPCVAADRTSDDPCPLTRGGGIYAEGGALTLVDSTLTGNDAAYGGGLWAIRVALRVEGGEISQNTGYLALYGYEDQNVFQAWDGAGGGMWVEGGSVALSGALVTGNTAPYGGGMRIEDADLTAADAVFSANVGHAMLAQRRYSSATWGGDGGGILVEGVGETTLVDVSFVGNTALFGGGIAHRGATLTVDGGLFEDNVAWGEKQYYDDPWGSGCSGYPEGPTHIYAGQGGAVYTEGPATVEGATLRGNKSLSGGGIHVEETELTLTGSDFVDNGGSLTARTDSGYVACGSVQYSEHSTTWEGTGGGVRGRGATLFLEDLSFTGGRGVYGSAITATGGDLTLYDALMDTNLASGQTRTEGDSGSCCGSGSSSFSASSQAEKAWAGRGGDILLEEAAHATLSNLTSTGAASLGAGGSLAVVGGSTLVLNGGQLSAARTGGMVGDNSSWSTHAGSKRTRTWAGSGGAVYVSGSRADLIDVEITGVEAILGGAIASVNSTLSVTGARLNGGAVGGPVKDTGPGTAQTVDGRGGLVYVSGGAARLRQVALVGGEALVSGGDGFIGGTAANGPFILSDVTAVGGMAPSGAGVRLETGGGVTLSNTLIAFNDGEGLSWGDEHLAPAAHHCDLYGNAGPDASDDALFDGEGMISADPRFAAWDEAGPPEDQDLHLTPGSPCLGAGAPLGDGSPTDIGAYGLADGP